MEAFGKGFKQYVLLMKYLFSANDGQKLITDLSFLGFFCISYCEVIQKASMLDHGTYKKRNFLQIFEREE